MDRMRQIIENISLKHPLVHFITNYVTVNDCANMCLAYGGSPIMADDADEVADIVSLASALLLNIGTLSNTTIRAMLTAGRKANQLETPVVFDPVGAGASTLRNETVKFFMKELEFTAIKGNISEIKNLFGGFTDTKGVDAAAADLVTEGNLAQSVYFARELSVMSGAVIIITGPIDIISGSHQTYVCRNGHSLMTKVTGTGCMLGGVIAGFIAANPNEPLMAAAAAVAAMGICGELAFEKKEELGFGTAVYRNMIIDCMSTVNAEILEKHMKLELYQ